MPSTEFQSRQVCTHFHAYYQYCRLDKLARNRESARKSRRRRLDLIASLEEEVQALKSCKSKLQRDLNQTLSSFKAISDERTRLKVWKDGDHFTYF